MLGVALMSEKPGIAVSRLTTEPSLRVVVLKVKLVMWPLTSVSLVHSVKVSPLKESVQVSVGVRVLKVGSAEEMVMVTPLEFTVVL
jgi:hypothetical protein